MLGVSFRTDSIPISSDRTCLIFLFRYHVDDKLSHWAGGGGYATTGAIGATAGSGGDAVDDCGLKFLLAVRQHTTLLRSLPLGHRASLEVKVHI